MNRKCKKLKPVEPIIKPQRSDILVRPQFSRYPIPRKGKEMKKLPHISSPLDVNATGEVLLGSAAAGPVGALMGPASATLRTFAHMGAETVKTISDTAEKTRAEEEKTS